MTIWNICVVFFLTFMLTFSGAVSADDNYTDIITNEAEYTSGNEKNQVDVSDEDAIEDEQYNASDEDVTEDGQFNTIDEDVTEDEQFNASDEDAMVAKYARNSRDRLHPGQKLKPHQSLRSRNGIYRLTMQGDGNLVLYTNSGRALWSTKTHNVSIKHCIMQKDGNLVLYRHDGRAQWHSRTHGKPNSMLVLQNDGNLVIYHDPKPKAIWHTGTGR